MKDRIENTFRDIQDVVSKISFEDELEAFRIKYLSRKGIIASFFDELKNIPQDTRREVGKMINELRDTTNNLYEKRKEYIETGKFSKTSKIDLTLPGRKQHVGHQHVISKTIQDIKAIFIRMGFCVATGPEMETDYYNFGALNFAPDHPARDMQDTFFIDDTYLLRTHTTPVQIRVMEKEKPPIRIIMPGKVYRNEVISARSHVQFQQIDGLYVDEGVTFADLKGTLVSFAIQYYGSDLKYRFRPSFFPFTEPSAEMDITCYLCNGKGCRVCKYTGWLEILGCGMVDPNVFEAVHVDSEKYTGYAFGMGIERVAMLRTGIDDIRILLENDIRMLRQFN